MTYSAPIFDILELSSPEGLANASNTKKGDLWLPNHMYQVIEVSASATDICDPSASHSTIVYSDEPDDAKGYGAGLTSYSPT